MSKTAKILVVDDEPNMLLLFTQALGKNGYAIETAGSGEEAAARLDEEAFDVVISDLMLPGMDGLDLLQKVASLTPAPPLIVMSAYGTIPSAVKAMKEGAYDYLAKPLQMEEVDLVITRALEHSRLKREVEQLRDQVEVQSGFGHLLGKSKKMRDLFRLIAIVANSHSTVLIQGESGTGKELVARAIHYNSPRAKTPFVAVDCGAVPETLLESELFGHVRGAFTGAIQSKRGLIEEADGGTLLLDEIGDTTIVFQTKLLRVLQEKEVRPVGSNRSVKVDPRIIAATNKNLKEAITKGTFREELYYRLAVVTLHIPPLRERREDIPLLAVHFLKHYCALNDREIKTFTPEAMRLLLEYPWPGNVRELENVVERAVLLTSGREINAHALSLTEDHARPRGEAIGPSLKQVAKETTDIIVKEKILEALGYSHGNKSRAAQRLGISRASLYNKLKLYHITKEVP